VSKWVEAEQWLQLSPELQAMQLLGVHLAELEVFV